jgi:dethiobiotin synthetase
MQITPRILFVTGTDTGVGKTLLTGLLVAHLLDEGKRVVALKPFCSGGTGDVDFLFAIQRGAVARDTINAFYFAEPVAPLVSARLHRRRVRLANVVGRIQKAGEGCEYILIEGSGGLLVPLGVGFQVRDLIQELHCEVILVSCNRLGTINHTLLSLEALRSGDCGPVKIAVMDPQRVDFSARSNLNVLRELCHPTSVISVPYIGRNALRPAACDRNAKKLKKTLASILG